MANKDFHGVLLFRPHCLYSVSGMTENGGTPAKVWKRQRDRDGRGMNRRDGKGQGQGKREGRERNGKRERDESPDLKTRLRPCLPVAAEERKKAAIRDSPSKWAPSRAASASNLRPTSPSRRRTSVWRRITERPAGDVAARLSLVGLYRKTRSE